MLHGPRRDTVRTAAHQAHRQLAQFSATAFSRTTGPETPRGTAKAAIVFQNGKYTAIGCESFCGTAIDVSAVPPSSPLRAPCHADTSRRGSMQRLSFGLSPYLSDTVYLAGWRTKQLAHPVTESRAYPWPRSCCCSRFEIRRQLRDPRPVGRGFP